MKRFAVIPVVALAFAACNEAEVTGPETFTPAFASAQFTTNGAKAPTATLNSDGSLLLTFKISGLGQNVNVDVTAHADATVVESCVNGGGNIPEDAKKTETTVSVDHTEAFQSEKNGSVEASITLPLPSGDLECPPGQTATLISAVWTNLSISFLSEFGQTGLFSFGGQIFSF